MIIFLIFMYIYESNYEPVPDLGHRPTISVIIPAKNEEDSIQRTVKAVLDSDYPDSKLNVIVINDGSTDNTADKVRAIKSERVTLIDNRINQGKRIAFADGFKIATGEIIVAIDSDSFVEPDAIKLLVQPFKREQVSAVAGHGNAYNKDTNMLTKLQHYWYQEMFRLAKAMESKLCCVTCCSGVLAAYRKSALSPILEEWLGETFLGKTVIIGDDRQLTHYVIKGNSNTLPTRKIKSVYQSNAIVHTVVPDNLRQFIKQQLRWKRSWICENTLASKFMWKKPLSASIYFYSYQFLNYMTPIVIFVWLVWRPLHSEWSGLIPFIVAIYYTGFLYAINIWKYETHVLESIVYRTVFVTTISVLTTIFILPYALVTMTNSGWITRKK
jgi:hyaluronan synthase